MPFALQEFSLSHRGGGEVEGRGRWREGWRGGGAIVDTTSGCLVFRFVGNSSR